MSFILDKNIRENEILKIQEGTPSRTGIKLPIRPTDTFNVYKIPLDLLVYNHLNDRFASQRMEYVSLKGHELNLDNEDSMSIIEKFIWESNIKSNQQTIKDIAKNGQRIHGVVTKDGRIIDGNRRFSLLRKLFYDTPKEFKYILKEKYRFFEAVVLPDDIDDSEMLLLETQLQMGEDEKVDYNAIEKYLKVNKLKENGISYQDISNMIKSVKNKNDAEKMHRIYQLMSEYLKYIDADNRFSLIKRYEDHFINLEKVLKYFEDGNYQTNWNPDKTDIFELKKIAFDYIRKGHEGKDFRNIMGGQKDKKGVFAHQDVWNRFKNNHEKNILNINEELGDYDFSGLDVTERESIWRKKINRDFDNNLELAKDGVKNNKYIEEPFRLIQGAVEKIRLINVKTFENNLHEYEQEDLLNSLNEIKEKSESLISRLLNVKD